jgi:hypothetical protein
VPDANHGTLRRSAFAACVGVLLCVVADQAIFGSGWYLQFLDPDSLAGHSELTLQSERNRPPSLVPEVAIIGNSMMAEGFSAKIADAESSGRLRFANLSVPGSTPRSWYYQVRATDPDGKRYRAIVLQAEEYSDEDGFAPMADRISDLHLIDGWLSLRDAADFAFSYHDPRLRFEALRGAVLKGYVFKSDLQAFLEAPSKRLERVAQFRRGYAGWTYDYEGHHESLSGMSVDWAHDRIVFPAGVPARIQQSVRETVLRKRAPLTGMQARYRQLWFGRILNHYRLSQARIIFIRPPRGPAVNIDFDRADEPSTIRRFASRPEVTVVPAETFQSLESPENFWDELHMNTTGRNQFSRMLAREVEQAISPKPEGSHLAAAGKRVR